ncbi:protoporphyrinogen/coproporphyrinogen oxidase [Pseudokineococcus lusitanus]|uniref:Oxygen-dependent protoporphyrinogen oxidase n=1 Tax=Pseudokineococcus lusitanus TaxID=763993 RepID=A0A3N1G947_9ACTN|nr:FAD-dependent oxidoreductase [Pseudokineococcus lusitanus]ROP26688.1 oxygen-dependent protoporphyrinogen oxidase [Pseudokineococcus lusitanus]
MTAPVVVVGAGVSGLVAARDLLAAGLPVVVLEASARTGGVLSRGALDVAGPDGGPLLVDTGPESLLARRPEAVALVRELGLGEDVVHPEAVPPAVATRGRLHALPPGTVMGVPRTTAHLAGLLDAGEVARVAGERVRPLPEGTQDVAVAAWVEGRVGRAVVDRLVEPLLGGVYAGSADRLSLRSTVPALWHLATAAEPLLAPPAVPPAPVPAVAADAPTTAGPAPVAGGPGVGAPVFAGVAGGVGRLAEALERSVVAGGGDLRTATPATALRRAAPEAVGDGLGGTHDGARWVVGTRGGELRARAVVVALPAPAASRLLRDAVPAASAALAEVRTASSAIATLAVPGAAMADVRRSGLLVPPVEGGLVKAATFSSTKWGWLGRAAGDLAVLRVSAGRAGDDAALDRDDADLVATAAAEVGGLLGRDLPVVAGRVDRWRDGLPQYDVGHAGRVDRAREAAAGAAGLVLAGSTYEGVGVPACVAVARAAARDVVADLGATAAGAAAPGTAGPAGPGTMGA